MSRIRWVLWGILSFAAAACGGPATALVPLTATVTPAAVASPTIPPTATPVATATPAPTPSPTPAAKSEWQCDPSGGVACFASLGYITMPNPEEGWAYGEDGLVLHYSMISGRGAPAWQQVESLDAPLRTMKMVSPTEGWGIIGNGIAHYQDGKWQLVGPGGFNDLDMLNPQEGWAVGYDLIYRYQQGKWEKAPIPVRKNLQAVATLNGEEAWAVGLAGTLLHYHNRQWEPIATDSSNPAANLYAVKMFGPGEGWIVGETILRYG